MKEQWKQLFHIPKKGKLPEKVMLARVSVSVCFILLCLAAMSISAYAFFSASVTSGMNTLQAAVYQLNVTPPTELEPAEIYTLDNSGGPSAKEYSFTLDARGSNASVGYAKVEIQSGVLKDPNDLIPVEFKPNMTQYSEPIWSNEDAADHSRTIKISLGAGEIAKIRFISEWGSYSGDHIIQAGTISVNVGITTPENAPEAPQDQLSTSDPAADILTETQTEVVAEVPAEPPAEETTEPVEEAPETEEETEPAESETPAEQETVTEETPEISTEPETDTETAADSVTDPVAETSTEE